VISVNRTFETIVPKICCVEFHFLNVKVKKQVVCDFVPLENMEYVAGKTWYHDYEAIH